MRINEENFAMGNEEDIKPSYVEQVIYGHNVDGGAHPGIRKQISDTHAFYQSVKKSVQGVAEAAVKSVQEAQQASAQASGSVEEVKKAASDASGFAEDAKRYANRAERAQEGFPFIENGEWWVMNWDTAVFGPSGIMAEGKDGYTPQKGVDYFDGADGKDGKDGYTPQKGVDYFDGADGKDGKDGYTPVRGVDYWTEEDVKLLEGFVEKHIVENGVSGYVDKEIEAKLGVLGLSVVDGKLCITYEEG